MDLTPDPMLHEAAHLRTRWEGLARAAAEPNCFYAPEMLVPALRHMAINEEVRLLEAWRDGTLVGLLPVRIAPRHGRYPLRCVTNWVHRHCFFGAPLVRPNEEEAAWKQFLSALDQGGWAPNFLHLTLLDPQGANAAALESVCAEQRRGLREIHRYERAMLHSGLSADAYWHANVRGKKRKEIRRLQKRLQELGAVTASLLSDPRHVERWCDEFLALEKKGWKGAQGTAMACHSDEAAFFRECVAGALAAGRLMFLRIDLDTRPVAMLVNFLMGEGGFSFKIAFDETMGRFSPGVLIEMENLKQVLDGDGPAWMDSCAAAEHPMIDSLWGERRQIVQYRVQLNGGRRALAWQAVRSADFLAKGLRKARKSN